MSVLRFRRPSGTRFGFVEPTRQWNWRAIFGSSLTGLGSDAVSGEDLGVDLAILCQ
jgi:hypothetical protein